MPRTNAQLLAAARKIATNIAKKYGSVTSEDVRSHMALRKGENFLWIGQTFRSGFKWTGGYVTVDATETMHGGHAVKVWKLA